MNRKPRYITECDPAIIGTKRPRELHLDVESRSTVDLLKSGAYAYWEHKDTDTICAAFCVDDEPMQTWRQGQGVPDLILQAANENWIVYAHNAGFEHLSIDHSLSARHGWPTFEPSQYRCTAAMAAAMALPRALAGAASALGLEVQKDAVGRRLMLQMCKPRRVDASGIVWWDDDERMDRLVAYCKTDVEVERGLTKRLRALIPAEQELWFLDQKINTRGVRIDVPAIKAAQKLIAEATLEANKELGRLTKY